MKRLFLTLLIISLLACFLTGCAEPIGSIGGIGALDFLWLVPNRLVYDILDVPDLRFDRYNDLQIMSAEQGLVTQVSPIDPRVKMEIIINPDKDNETIEEIINRYYTFGLPGRHVIQVTYNGKTAKYSVEVLGGTGSYGDASGFLDIEWL